MQVSNNYSQQKFTSRLSPVKPFVINTKDGIIYVKEAKKKDFKQKDFINNLAKVFLVNIANNTEDPAWKIIIENSEAGKQCLKNFKNYLKKKIIFF